MKEFQLNSIKAVFLAAFLKACKETRSFKAVMNCLFFVLMTHEYEHMCYNN